MRRTCCDLELQLAEATHQVAKYAAEAKSAIDENERLFSQLAEARQQRDRLAEALRMIATHNEGDGQCDNGHTPRWLSLDALQSLTPNAKGDAPGAIENL
jgi:regulator of replication initiation timing